MSGILSKLMGQQPAQPNAQPMGLTEANILAGMPPDYRAYLETLSPEQRDAVMSDIRRQQKWGKVQAAGKALSAMDRPPSAPSAGSVPQSSIKFNAPNGHVLYRDAMLKLMGRG